MPFRHKRAIRNKAFAQALPPQLSPLLPPHFKKQTKTDPKIVKEKIDYFSTRAADDKYLEANADLSTMVNNSMANHFIKYVDIDTTQEELKKQIVKAFHVLDIDDSGELSTLELIVGLKEFGIGVGELL